jgi:hypothetical protein
MIVVVLLCRYVVAIEERREEVFDSLERDKEDREEEEEEDEEEDEEE